MNDDKVSSAAPIGHSTDKTSKDHRGTKSSHKELSNLMLFESIIHIQGINIGTLKPVTQCRKKVNEEVLLQQIVVFLNDFRRDAVFVTCFALSGHLFVDIAGKEGKDAAYNKCNRKQSSEVRHCRNVHRELVELCEREL